MRLLQVLLTQSEGGAETFFEKVAIHFQGDASVEQKLIIEAHTEREKRLEAAGCNIRALSVSKLAKTFLYNPILKASARRFKPDITFTWMNRASRKAPVLPEAIKVARIGGYYPLKNFLNCDYLVANTPELVGYMVDQGWDPKRIAMISNFGEIPPDTEHGTDPRSLVPEGQKILLTLGRLHRNKAQDVIIKALPHMPNTHLCIAGEGNLENKLKQLATEQNVANRVHFLGWRRDTKFLLDRSDICVFPSREEPLGNVVLEAWAAGRPIVAAESSGPKWLINHNHNGLLCSIDDHMDLAKLVNRLIEDPDLAKRLADEGYQEFKLKFTKEVIMGQYGAFFKELLDSKASKRQADLSPWSGA